MEKETLKQTLEKYNEALRGFRDAVIKAIKSREERNKAFEDLRINWNELATDFNDFLQRNNMPTNLQEPLPIIPESKLKSAFLCPNCGLCNRDCDNCAYCYTDSTEKEQKA